MQLSLFSCSTKSRHSAGISLATCQPVTGSIQAISAYLSTLAKTLAALFSAEDHQAIFAQLNKVLNRSSCRVALLGDAHHLYQVLAELLVSCHHKQEEFRGNHHLLTGYIAAADIAARGIVAFAVTAEALLRGHSLPERRS